MYVPFNAIVVSDDVRFCDVMTRFLSDRGLRVLELPNVEYAFDAMERVSRPVLAIVDCTWRSEEAVAKWMRSTATSPHRVLFLKKPFDLDGLSLEVEGFPTLH